MREVTGYKIEDLNLYEQINGKYWEDVWRIWAYCFNREAIKINLSSNPHHLPLITDEVVRQAKIYHHNTFICKELYFIYALYIEHKGTPLIKIGVSKNMTNRYYQHTKSMEVDYITPLAWFCVDTQYNALSIETFIKQQLNDYKYINLFHKVHKHPFQEIFYYDKSVKLIKDIFWNSLLKNECSDWWNTLDVPLVESHLAELRGGVNGKLIKNVI